MVPDKNEASEDAPQQLSSHRINGVVDLPRPNRVAGWAIDRADPDSSVTVEVLQAGRVIAKTQATAFRADLERSGLGTGNYGFAVELDHPVPPGMGFTISARATTADAVEDSLRQIGQTAFSDQPEQRLLQELLTQMHRLSASLSPPVEGSDAKQVAQGVPVARLLAVCERLEIAQAGQDTLNSEKPDLVERAVPRWLAWLVALGLAIGSTALAIGVYSLVAG